MVLLQGPEADVVEAVVSVTGGKVVRWEVVEDVRPPLQIEEAYAAQLALAECEEWNAALDRRGVVDRSLVQVDPWPAGTFGLEHEKRRRITKCLAYLRESADDNGYARPLEGLLAIVDMGRGEVLEVLDYGTVPIPPTSGSYYPEHNGPLRTDLKPLSITPARGPELRGGRQPGEVAEVVVAGEHGPARGPGPLDHRLRGRREGAAHSSTAPRSARWWCPTGTPARCTGGRVRSTPVNGVSGAWPTR